MKKPKDIPQDVWDEVQNAEKIAKAASWQIVGQAGIDSGQLLVCDPCYPMQGEPEFTYKDCCGPYHPDPTYHGAKQLMFKRGHAGAGVRIDSPHGDCTVTIWGKVDAKKNVHAVFFSFNGDRSRDGSQPQALALASRRRVSRLL